MDMLDRAAGRSDKEREEDNLRDRLKSMSKQQREELLKSLDDGGGMKPIVVYLYVEQGTGAAGS